MGPPGESVVGLAPLQDHWASQANARGTADSRTHQSMLWLERSVSTMASNSGRLAEGVATKPLNDSSATSGMRAQIMQEAEASDLRSYTELGAWSGAAWHKKLEDGAMDILTRCSVVGGLTQ